MTRRPLAIIAAVFMSGWAVQAAAAGAVPVLRFAIDQDYYEGRETLSRVEKDFTLAHMLSVGIIRSGIGWDDTNPRPEQFRWGFWTSVISAAHQAGIEMRPYYDYTPAWAGSAYNAPPIDSAHFARACGVLAEVIGHAVPSLEIWNEPDNADFWTGSALRYGGLLDGCASAVRAVTKAPQIVLGGLVYLDSGWLSRTNAAAPGSYDIAAFHQYSETPWNPITVEQINAPADFDGGYDGLSQHGRVPVWMNEGGASTAAAQGYSEATQADWIRRTVASVIGQPGRPVSLFGLYQLRDLDPALSKPIGDPVAQTFFLHTGIFRIDGHPKLGAATYGDLVRLLDHHRPAVQSDVTYRTSTGHVSDRFRLYAWRLETGHQVIMIWDRGASSSGTIALAFKGQSAFLHNADGSIAAVAGFDGRVVQVPALQAGGMPLLYEVR